MIKDSLHLKAPGNWMNDPNGFIYYQGKYHLFYQHFPYAPAWGTMHWGHAVSEDLVHWQHQDIALFPSKDYDRNGIFSGSAVEKDGSMLLYYTAVRYLEEDAENIHRCPEGRFESSQAMISSADGYIFDNWMDKRQIIPVVRDRRYADATHTRDPKVWEYGNQYYMVLGSTLDGQQGRVLFYRSEDGNDWEYVSQYSDKSFGEILECPDIFRVGDRYVFIGSPMGIMNDGLEYSAHSICTEAEFTEEVCELKLAGQHQFVDCGLDLYAPQTCLDKEGRRVMVAWMRMPYAAEADDRAMWRGMMCLPRIVELKENHVYFCVHPEVESYFCKRLEDREELDSRAPFRLKTKIQAGETIDIGGYRIWAEDDCIKTDRSKAFVRTDYGADTKDADNYRMISSTPSLHGKYELDIFVEPNLIEIFVNGGQYVLSNIVYGLGSRLDGHIEEIYIGASDDV